MWVGNVFVSEVMLQKWEVEIWLLTTPKPIRHNEPKIQCKNLTSFNLLKCDQINQSVFVRSRAKSQSGVTITHCSERPIDRRFWFWVFQICPGVTEVPFCISIIVRIISDLQLLDRNEPWIGRIMFRVLHRCRYRVTPFENNVTFFGILYECFVGGLKKKKTVFRIGKKLEETSINHFWYLICEARLRFNFGPS